VAWDESYGAPIHAGGLRALLTSFVGRESETADVVKLLGEHRLVTVTGPGGVGKTRLAVEAARRAVDQFPDGIRFVELTEVPGNGQVVGQLMTVFGLRDRQGVPPVNLLAEALAQRQMLLILDNCEHVLDGVAEVCRSLLQAADDVRVLATSREQLWVAGEVRYRLSSLKLPTSDDLEEVSRSEAVALFTDRALSADARFSLTHENAALVSRVVAWLDGMPLGIELAAARVEALGMAGLAELINDAVRLLAQPDRLPGGRHRSLTAVADWSYQLLPEPEKRVMRRLAAFPGPFTLEAAEAVAGPEADPVVLRLVDCSLLVPPQPGSDQRMRYTMLETLRAFGVDRLRKAGEEQEARAALCEFALSVAEEASAGLETADAEREALRWLDAEGATLGAAIAWAEVNDRDAALRFAAALAPWWRLRGRLTEARAHLDAALECASPASQGWAAARVWLAHLLGALGDPVGGTALLNSVCEPGNGTDRSTWAVDALLSRAVAKLNMGDADGAADDAGRALALARDIGCAGWEAPALTMLSATAFYGGDAALALDRVRQAEEMLSGSVPGYLARWCRMALTMVLTDAGEFDWGRRVCAAGIALAHEVGDLTELVNLLGSKVRLELLAGNLADAKAGLRQKALLSVQTAAHYNLWNCVYLCGFLCAATERWTEAVTFWAAADADAASHGHPDTAKDVYPPRRSEYVGQIERALSPAQIHDAQQRGAGMSLHAAIEFINMLTEPVSAEVQQTPGDGKLSAREGELVTLVARGDSNAQIAAKLHISVYTVRSHLDRIRDKTGCRRRADLTRLALRQGLI
jgi:predicted ATPase/DNA-binding CsgD family transcriptional regulator